MESLNESYVFFHVPCGLWISVLVSDAWEVACDRGMDWTDGGTDRWTGLLGGY